MFFFFLYFGFLNDIFVLSISEKCKIVIMKAVQKLGKPDLESDSDLNLWGMVITKVEMVGLV